MGAKATNPAYLREIFCDSTASTVLITIADCLLVANVGVAHVFIPSRFH